MHYIGFYSEIMDRNKNHDKVGSECVKNSTVH